jgi:acyl dehydratase
MGRGAGYLERDKEPAMPNRRVVRRGRFLEDFQVGDLYRHHWGRTLTAGEATLFTTWTMNANPLYFNRAWARRQGLKESPVNPLLAMNVVFGLSVEDLSEQALAHLGYWNLRFLKHVFPGDTLTAESVVLSVRESESKPDRGVVQVRTSGFNQDGDKVLEYERKILVKKRSHYEADAEPVKAPGAAG